MNGSKKIIIIFAIISIVVLGIAAYFVVSKQEKTVNLTKIDKLMFDTKNTPPKFLLTLPDVDQRLIDAIVNKEQVVKKEKKAKHTMADAKLLNQIPLISKLKKIKGKVPLAQITKTETKTPWVTYSKKTDIPNNFYKVAVIIKNVGLNTQIMEKIFEAIPDNVSLSFSPYTKDIKASIEKARTAGHETYFDILLAPKDYLEADNGPKALSLTASLDDNIKKTNDIINQDVAFGGIIVSKGIADTENTARLKKGIESINSRGLLFLDASSEEGFNAVTTETLPRGRADIIIDKNFNKKSILDLFEMAEKVAQNKGHVIIVLEPKPIVLVEFVDWISTFSEPPEKSQQKTAIIEKPFTLVPLSSVVIE